jgi:UDP-3-O-[3-hydroxymyristoyl] glucosamine N-acyltransferase
MITILNQDNQTCFGIKKIINQNEVFSCLKTSFVWSDSPRSLCLAVNKHYFNVALNNPNISGIIAFPQAVRHSPDFIKAGIIVAEKADELFYYLHNKEIHLPDVSSEENIKRIRDRGNTYIAPSAVIDVTAKLGENVWIGDNVVIHPGCIVLDNCTIQRNSVLHPYVTVGTEGFFSKHVMGTKIHIRHFGGVKIGENCIIHTGTNISRSVNYNENTTVSDHVHIGIHTNIGHDCQIGANSDISAKVLLAGRVRIGKNCWIGAGVTIANALSIGDGSKIMIGSVVISDVPDHATISGNFALNHITNLRHYLQNKRQQ